MSDKARPNLRFLQGDGPQDRVEITELRPKRFHRAAYDGLLLSDNPYYDHYRKPRLRFLIPALRRVRLQGVQLQMPQHLIRMDGQVYFDLCINRHTQWRDEPQVRIDGHTRIGTNASFHNYFHWMVECLPGLAHYHRAGQKVLMPPLPDAWQRAMLAAAGLADIDHVEFGRQVYDLESVAFLSTAMHATSGSHRMALWGDEVVALLNRVTELPQVAARTGAFPERLFISRRDARKRPFVDEDRIAEHLRPLGFHPVVLTDHDTADQIAMFRGATAVVAAHGAGLVNIAHCRPGTQIFEIQHPSCSSSVFLKLAHQFNLAYAMYQEFDPELPADARMQSWGIRDIGHLQEALFRFLGAPV